LPAIIRCGNSSEKGAYIEENLKSGVLVASEGCLPSALGAKVRRMDGKFAVIDGPFSEAKDDPLNDSDHYPVKAVLTISAQD